MSMPHKKFYINNKVYTFDVIQDMYGGCVYAKCRENGKYAFLDIENGVQFEDEHKIIAKPYDECKSFIPAGFHYWGGELRHNVSWRSQW